MTAEPVGSIETDVLQLLQTQVQLLQNVEELIRGLFVQQTRTYDASMELLAHFNAEKESALYQEHLAGRVASPMPMIEEGAFANAV